MNILASSGRDLKIGKRNVAKRDAMRRGTAGNAGSKEVEEVEEVGGRTGREPEDREAGCRVGEEFVKRFHWQGLHVLPRQVQQEMGRFISPGS